MTEPQRSAYPATTTGPDATNPVGAAALVAGVVVLVLAVIQQIIGRTLPYWMDSLGGAAGIATVLNVMAIVVAVAGLVALVLGWIGVTRPSPRKAAAGVGLGIGLFSLTASVVGFLVGLVVLLMA